MALTTAEAEAVPDCSMELDTLLQYRTRSAGALQRAAKRRKREIEKAHGMLSGSDAVTVPTWADLLREECHFAAQRASTSTLQARRPRPRGASLANRVSVKQRARPERHVQRKEQQALRLQAQVKAAKAYRAAQVQKLRSKLFNDDATSLLCQPADGAAISQRQAARATTQGWVVLKTYEEIERMEDEILNSGAKVPHGGIAKAAAASAVAAFGGICDADTARAWRFEYEQNEGQFELDGRGKWQRELLIHEEDLARKFHKWMVVTAKEERLSVEAAREYLNGTLLRPPHVKEETLHDYHMTLPISNSTAHFWMLRCGAQCGKFAQSYYNDHHESELVIKDRTERYIPAMMRDERRKPLWVQLPLAEYEALCAATVKADGELPEGYRYKLEGGEQMVELHVDDSNHFEAFRTKHPLGGDFSVQWKGRPRSPPSAPPASLPDPGVDATPTGGEELAAEAEGNDPAVGTTEAAAVGTAGAPSVAPGPPLMAAGAIRALKVAEAREACKAHGLSEAGLKPELIARLLSHRTLTLERQACGADAAEGEDGEDGEALEYDVKKIHAIRWTEAGAIEYDVEWEGWEDANGNPERTWEPEANIDGCKDKLAAFYLDPEHRKEGCAYGHRKEVCKCHLPILGEGQDEAIYKPFVYSSKQWKICGVSSVRKKTEGSGEMVSATTGELRGFGFPMTPEEVCICTCTYTYTYTYTCVSLLVRPNVSSNPNPIPYSSPL